MNDHVPSRSPDDETYWATVRAQYTVSPDFINLENGFFGMQATPVFEAWQRIERQVHLENAYFLRKRRAALLASVQQALARFCGCDPSELLITRNVIEALNIVIQGYPFERGDEVLIATHDYDEVVSTLTMTAARKSLTVSQVRIPLDPASDQQIIGIYRDAITPQTRVLLLTHMVHRTGQIMPVEKITAMARELGVDVIVDAAHAFAQIEFKVPQLGADFVGVNLHKWLGAPLGVGMLYIRKRRISDIAPLFGDVRHAADDIGKLGNVGTVPPGPILAIPDAIAFHQSIGGANKEARLRYLTQYWLSRVLRLPNVHSLTPSAPERSCAIAIFAIDGIAAGEVVRRLLDEHQILTVVRQVDGGDGVRVTPHLYTRIDDLDLLVNAVTQIAGGRNHAGA